jgi:mono/diheme cytochrome c family protein
MSQILNAFLAVSVACVSVSASQPVIARQEIPSGKSDQQQIERGRYVVNVAACNDCHTAGFGKSGGRIPESQRLMGDTLGFRGPWGTTYPINLRLYMNSFSMDQWEHVAKSMQARPPMPWWVLHDMSLQDLRAVYAYVKWLGPAGEPAPTYLPPEKEPAGPVVQFPLPPKED